MTSSTFRRLVACALVCASTGIALASRRAPGESAFREINGIVASLSKISGLAEEHPVPYGHMTKPALRKFLAKRIKKSLRPEEIHADELALKMFGLVPENFDLKKSTIDLLTEQAAAFYDYDKKKLFLLQVPSFSDEIETLAHELAHALADQHFDLEKFMDDTASDDDANLARTAVVEGQATWLMMAYSLDRNHQPPEPTREMLTAAFSGESDSAAQYPILKASPLYIQQSLLFPYAQGTLFFDAVYRRDGKKAFSSVFTNPPSDSMQILHPDRYFRHMKSTRPALPKALSANKDDVEAEGSVGEFDHEILLWQYFDHKEALDLSPHVLGGQFRILQHGSDASPTLLYSSEWDSPQTAGRYFAAYQHILESKWKHVEVSEHSANLFAGHSENGYFVVKLKGPIVSSVEGLVNETEWHLLKHT